MYIPPSQYKTGYYSNGEYSLGVNEYTGPYWLLLNGDAFTGEKPNPNSQLLLLTPPKDNRSYNNIQAMGDPSPNVIGPTEELLNINPNMDMREIPPPFSPLPPPSNVTNFTRHFAKRNDSYEYMEISSGTFFLLQRQDNTLAWDLYSTAQLTWTVSGENDDVYNKNKKIVLEIEKTPSSRFPNGKNWLGFSQIFKDNYLQFHQDSNYNPTILPSSNSTTRPNTNRGSGGSGRSGGGGY